MLLASRKWFSQESVAGIIKFCFHVILSYTLTHTQTHTQTTHSFSMCSLMCFYFFCPSKKRDAALRFSHGLVCITVLGHGNGIVLIFYLYKTTLTSKGNIVL